MMSKQVVECLSVKGFFGKYRFLSNFWYVPIEYEGRIYPTLEHAYQAQKCYLDEDKDLFTDFNLKPKDAKRIGRFIKCIDFWDDRKLKFMRELLIIKFQNKVLRQKLIELKDYYLEETNIWGDTFFGVYKGIGENHLGKLLMEIRDNILEEETLVKKISTIYH